MPKRRLISVTPYRRSNNRTCECKAENVSVLGACLAAPQRGRPHTCTRRTLRLVATPTVVVLEGDETGQELLVEALRVLDPAVIGMQLAFERFDLSLERRRATGNTIVYDAAAAMKRTGLGLKAATITPEAKGDVGSPNAILRQEIDGKVIVRTGRRLPGVLPVGGVSAPMSVVRMAVDDAYNAKEWREGTGQEEKSFRTEMLSRANCRR